VEGGGIRLTAASAQAKDEVCLGCFLLTRHLHVTSDFVQILGTDFDSVMKTFMMDILKVDLPALHLHALSVLQPAASVTSTPAAGGGAGSGHSAQPAVSKSGACAMQCRLLCLCAEQ
jgi:hypothetical protein